MSYDIIDPKITGRRIYLARHQQKLSLRSLAKRVNLSHGYLHRIEQGIVHPSEETVLKLLDGLNIKFLDHKKKNVYFDNVYEELYNSVLYMESDKTLEIYNTLKKHHDYYVNSTRFVEYNYIRLTVIIDLRIDYEVVDEVFANVRIMEYALNAKDKERLCVLKGIYMILKSDLDGAWDYIQGVLPTIEDSHVRARLYYLLGFIITNDYLYYNQALNYFEKSREFFELHMNYTRVHRSKAMQQILYVFLHRFEEFDQSLKDTVHFALRQNNKPLYHFTQVNRVRYHIIQENYKEALEILEHFEVEIFQYYFYKVYSYFKLQRNVEALNEIKRFRAKQGLLVTNIDEQVISLIEHAIINGMDDKYMERCKALCDLAHKQHDFIVIQISTQLYTEALEARRFYKEAFIYADKFLAVLYKLH